MDFAAVVRSVVPYLGIAGLGLVVFYYLFREFIRKSIFPQLPPGHAYRLLRLFLIFSFVVAVLAMAVGAFMNHRDAEAKRAQQDRENEAEKHVNTRLDQLQEENKRLQEESSKLVREREERLQRLGDQDQAETLRRQQEAEARRAKAEADATQLAEDDRNKVADEEERIRKRAEREEDERRSAIEEAAQKKQEEEDQRKEEELTRQRAERAAERAARRPLYCCDAYGNRVCPMVVPTQVGFVCNCGGFGAGSVCQ
jgi:DNA segregation ATPase FtsK/SpoIIIE-like protein